MSPAQQIKSPVMLSPKGEYLEIPQSLFDAVDDFMKSRRTGRLEVHFRDGGVASVEGNYKKTYAGEKLNGHAKKS